MTITLEQCRRAAKKAAKIMRRIINAPDYDTYVGYFQTAHPEATPLSYEEFAKGKLEDSYCRPGSRCC